MTNSTLISLEDLVELDERESNGIRVTLIWNRATNCVSVLVYDEKSQDAFALEVSEGDDALDIFNHPFAYAAYRGLVREEADPVEQVC